MINVIVMYGGQSRFSFATNAVPRAGDFVFCIDTDECWHVEHVTWHVSSGGEPGAKVVLQARPEKPT